MEQRLISRLASETQECIAAREELNQQVQIFASGEETCNKFIQMREPESDSDDDDDDAAFFDTNERTVKVENGSEGGLFEATPPPSAGRKRPENGPTGSTGSPYRKKRSRKT
ncbi:hypothetical protein PSTG_18815 [Puccinia striiformis f. sp. tritici PST-78]|uniref:Uncharacterized protein n=1 Tax=Puccinia striiformis f. sp. tritici PST-78 TaxID=1165861 RepID=A0A0L0ULZ4_9BASI|nr:hypothetical protein PSTG_18815 [Puccinia striiformis f. sp. tritici PST-78]